MDVNIDKTGSYDEPTPVEGLVGFAAELAGGSDLDHAAVFEQEVIFALKMLSGVDEETVADCERSFVVHAKTKSYFAADLRR
jgi:hypothetical protein